MPRTLEFQQGLLLEREDRIKRIEGDILDVNQIMRELAALVHQQGDTIGRYLFSTLKYGFINGILSYDMKSYEMQKCKINLLIFVSL